MEPKRTLGGVHFHPTKSYNNNSAPPKSGIDGLITICETRAKILTYIWTPWTVSAGKQNGEMVTRNNKRPAPSRIPKCILILKIEMESPNLWIEDLKKKIALKRLQKNFCTPYLSANISFYHHSKPNTSMTTNSWAALKIRKISFKIQWRLRK